MTVSSPSILKRLGRSRPISACFPLEPAWSGKVNEEFYAESAPLNRNAIPAALSVTGFDLDQLARTGEEPLAAMQRFADWVKQAASESKPVFLGFNVALRLVVRELVLSSFSGRESFRLCPSRHQILLYGTDRLHLARDEVQQDSVSISSLACRVTTMPSTMPGAGSDVRENDFISSPDERRAEWQTWRKHYMRMLSHQSIVTSTREPASSGGDVICVDLSGLQSTPPGGSQPSRLLCGGSAPTPPGFSEP